jgi:hypothetical protein
LPWAARPWESDNGRRAAAAAIGGGGSGGEAGHVSQLRRIAVRIFF